MCLPQVPRTESEQTVFEIGLANMGVLYSMFPVLVLSEVPPGVRDYFTSGWCFSEFVSALLGDQLQSYAPDTLVRREAQALREELYGGRCINDKSRASMEA